MLNDDTPLKSNGAEIAAKIVDGEAILINLDSGLYYSMGGAGAFVWTLLDRGATIMSMADAVAARFRVAVDQVRDDLRDLASELVAERLAVVVEAPSAGAGDGPDLAPEEEIQTADAYESPRLVKYDDMAEIFALDPPLPELPPLNGSGGSEHP